MSQTISGAVSIALTPDRETKNTQRFAALDANGAAIEDAALEAVYVPKTTLESLGWKPGGVIQVNINVA